MTAFQIDPNLQLGAVTLSVADLSRSLDYYQHHIGLTVREQDSDSAELGTPNRHLLTLREIKGAPFDKSASGLYHFALLLPSRRALAQTIQHFVDSRTPVGGASDHRVSEALYLTDPDGHGIEIYRDRPRSAWTNANGDFYMTTDRMRIDEVMAELDDSRWRGIDSATVMGHVHLQVRDEREAEAFYTGVLGFNHMIDYPHAAFVSAGGYHHHLGMNTWHSRGNGSAPAGHARLEQFEIVLSSGADVEEVCERLDRHAIAYQAAHATATVHDPSGNRLVIKSS